MNAQRLTTRDTSTPNISAIIGGMRKKLKATITTQEKALHLQQERERVWREEMERENRLAIKRLTANLKTAVAGVRRIIAFAQTPDVQELIRIEGELRMTCANHNTEAFISSDEGEFLFFIGSYISADDDSGVNDRHAYVVLKPHALWFVAQDYDANDDERLIEIPFVEYNKMETYLTSEEVPKHFNRNPIISSETRRENRISPLKMWREGNSIPFGDYSTLFGKILIECADPEMFKRYCSTALAYLAR